MVEDNELLLLTVHRSIQRAEGALGITHHQLAVRTAVNKDVLFRTSCVNIGGCEALIVAAIPFPKIRIHPRGVKSGQFACAVATLDRTGEHMVELDTLQPRAEARRAIFTVFGKLQIRAAYERPGGCPMAQNIDLCGYDSRGSQQGKGSARVTGIGWWPFCHSDGSSFCHNSSGK